jgi:hypothetical protein
MVREFWDEFRELQADGSSVDGSRLDFHVFLPFSFEVFYVEFGVGWCGNEPEAGAILPADDAIFEEEALGVDFDPLLSRDVVMEERVEEAAEEDEDGEGPVPGVGPIACETEDDDEEQDVPPRCSVVLGVLGCAPTEEWCEFFHKSLYFSIFTWWAIVDLNH